MIFLPLIFVLKLSKLSNFEVNFERKFNFLFSFASESLLFLFEFGPDNGSKNRQNRLDLKGIQDFSDGAKVRVTLEELHNGGRTFLAGSSSENILTTNDPDSMKGKGM